MMTTKLNPVQLHLLQMFAHDLAQTELEDIKKLLADYFVQKADDEMMRLQTQKNTSQQELDKLLLTHLRTPYKEA